MNPIALYRRPKAKTFSNYSTRDDSVTNASRHQMGGEFDVHRKGCYKGKVPPRSKHSASPMDLNVFDSPSHIAITNRHQHRIRRHVSLECKSDRVEETRIALGYPETTDGYIDGIHIPALRIVPKRPSLHSTPSVRKSRNSLRWQSQDAIIDELNAKLGNLTQKYNEMRSRNWDMIAETKKLEALNNEYFTQNQKLKRKVKRLKKRETTLKKTHAEELQAKDEKILKFGIAVSRRDADIERRRVQNRKLQDSEKKLLEGKQALQILVDSRANIIKLLELKLQTKGSRIQDLESIVEFDDHPEKAIRLMEDAKNLVTEVTKKNEDLMKDLEAMTEMYEMEKEYSAASRPLMEIGAAIRMRYIYERLIELGIMEDMPPMILPMANRHVHWADMKADLAIFKSGVWTVEKEGAFFKAVYPTHTVESCISLKSRSNERILSFMSLGIMYQDLHNEGRDFGLRDSEYSEEFEDLWKELQQYLAGKSRLDEVGTEMAEHEETYIEGKLDSLIDLMAAFRRVEDTKIAISWLAKDEKPVEAVVRPVNSTVSSVRIYFCGFS
jgi:hypothetical protein